MQRLGQRRRRCYVTAAGRDFLSLIFLLGVMVYQDPVMSLVTLVIAPPIVLVMRQLVRRARTVIFKKYTSGVPVDIAKRSPRLSA